MKEVKEYNIGLDIGTNSVGWAVTDSSNNLVKYKGQNMWGSRLFEEGKTALERRNFRSARRRLDRRRERINLCQRLFEEEVNKKDPNFFMKLKESSLLLEDRKEMYQYNLFTDSSYSDADYYKEYPTIYHLRYDLIKTNVQKDIRLVYLAIHHILKYRGNFLYEHEDFDVNNLELKEKLVTVLKELNEKYSYVNDFEISFANYEKVESIFIDNKISRREKQELLINEFSLVFTDKKILKEIIALLVGLESKVYLIFERDDLKDEKLLKIKFSDSNFEDNKDEIETLLQEDFGLITSLKDIYNTIYLLTLFNGEKESLISKIMIDRYIKHGDDLKKLKHLLKENLPSKEYNSFFKGVGLYSYTAYIKNIGKCKSDKANKIRNCSYEDFKGNLKKILSNISSPIADEMIIELDNDTFLRKINVVENSMYPYQLNKIELEKIIENQGEYYPFLKEKTNDGTYKLVKLLEFRIPYYVGPLNLNASSNGESRSFSWIVKKGYERITPYNFNDVVDLTSSAENFIKRMTSFCTYLVNEKVIPKNSLLYTKFNVLSELKQIRINNHKMPIKLINKVIDDLFIREGYTNITDKIFKKWLVNHTEYRFIDNLEITGYQKDKCFANNMKVYSDFISIFGKIDEYNYDMIEQLIEWITIFEDKKILLTKIKEYYPELDKNTIDKIMTRNYQGWSRLSRELLAGEKILYIDNFNVCHTIMDLLETTNENFMQIINNKIYGFEEKIHNYNYNGCDKELDVMEAIGKLPGSPAIKKGIYQSVKIVDEIVKLMKCNPKHIFVEMARDEGKKNSRTITRNNYILNLYDNLKNNVTDSKELGKLIAELKDNEKLDDRKLYLYFLQYGKCLYSGKSISINELSQCEIDHIIPRSLIKDDSFDNLALVYREYNQRKSDGLLLNSKIVDSQRYFWKMLHDNKLMSDKKYYNLTRKEYREQDITNFINRQLVETRQISKHVVNLLNEVYGKDTVVSVYANLVKNYKDKYKLYKFRQINNFHHARDAYLTTTLGNYLLIRYPKDKNLFIFSNYKKYFSKEARDYFNNMKNGYGYIINNISNDYCDNNGEVIIDAKEFNEKISRIYYYNDPIISKKTEIQTGLFYNQNPLKKGSNLIPKKKGLDPKKYGGYSGENKAYYMLIEYMKKCKKEKKLLGIPVALYELSKISNEDVIGEYISKEIGNIRYKVLRKCIKKYQLINYKDQLCYIVSAREICNAVEFKFDREHALRFNELLNFICNDKFCEVSDDEIDELFKYILGKIEKYYPIYSSELSKIRQFYDRGYYEKLDIFQKKKLILELFRMLDTTSNNARLSFLTKEFSEIKFDDRVGRKHGQNINDGFLIYKSITGLNSSKWKLDGL